jgi:ABC-type glycerol-3-phosphate transport system permease component
VRGPRRRGTALLPVAVVLWLLPVYLIAIESLRGVPEEWRGLPLVVVRPTLQWYVGLLDPAGGLPRTPFARPLPASTWLRTTLVVLAQAVVLTLLLGTAAAYALARFGLPGSGAIRRGILGLVLLPPPMLVLPVQHLAFRFHLDDLPSVVAVVYALLGVPLCVWIMARCVERVPHDLEDAAVLEGASRLWILGRVLLPASLPGLGASGFVTAVVGSGDLLLASAVLPGHEHQTLAAGLAAMDVSMDDLSVIAGVNLAALLVLPGALGGARWIGQGLTSGWGTPGGQRGLRPS